jgi:ribonuclease J
MSKLRVIPLGGLGEFGLNMMLLEYGDSIIAVDCGLMFPGAELPGIDLVIPDVGYLLEKKERLIGVVLTHAHEDHIGALPYLLPQLSVPVFGTRLTLGLLRSKLEEHDLIRTADLREIKAAEPWDLGPFRIDGIKVTHSLMDCLALAIHTPLGTVIHTGDFKIDHTPMEGEVFDYQKFSAYGEQGILLLLSDSTNVERRGYTPSEREVGKGFEEIFYGSRGRIFIATFSSNIPRIQQIADLSMRFGRRLVLSGRSMIHNSKIASELGYLRLPSDVLMESDRWQSIRPDEITFLTTGSQGEPLSVLHRVALDDHKQIKIRAGDTVVLSARFIPGNERTISNLINHLYRRGAEVHYERVSEVHVSGHASQEELKTMIHLTRPRYFVPVHGEYRNLLKHLKLAQGVGVAAENCFLLEDGEVLEITSEGATKAAPVTAGRVFVDGKGVGDVEDVVIRDRRHLSQDGMVLAVMAIHQQTGELVAGPDLVSRGFIRSEDGEEVLEQAKRLILEIVKNVNRETRTDPLEMQQEVRKALRRHFFDTLQRRPVVLPFILEM